MIKIIFTNHAKERMQLRMISEKMIRLALMKPDDETIGYSDKLIMFKKFIKQGTIKIVYTKTGDNYLIISVIWHKKA